MPAKPPKPPANPDPSALGAAAAPAAAAPAAFICMKGRKTSGFIRGPSADVVSDVVNDKASHPGIAPYEEIRLDSMPPSENPFVDKRLPKGPATVEAVEEVPPDAEDKGDARLFSAPVIAEVSCDSADCTPPLTDEPAD
jgi:hypothetical protein